MSEYSALSLQGASSYPIASADVNGDGRADLVYASGSNLQVSLGNADGTFTTDSPNALGLSFVNAGGIVTGYVNNDTNADIVVSDYPTGRILTLLGNGDGTFQSPVVSHSPGIGGGVALGDFNADGVADLAVANTGGSAPTSIMLGDGIGGFALSAQLPATFDALEVAAKDLNGDGRADVAFTPYGNAVEVFLSNADGTFTQTPSIPISGSGGVALEDVNNVLPSPRLFAVS